MPDNNFTQQFVAPISARGLQPLSKSLAEADTPDPNSYHFDKRTGSVVLPRAKFNGTSPVCDATRPGVVNVIASDYSTGSESTFQVDMSKLSEVDGRKLFQESQGDPLKVLAAVSGQSGIIDAEQPAPQPVDQVGTQGQYGYVVPTGSAGGSQSEFLKPAAAPAANSGHFVPLGNGSIQPTEQTNMAPDPTIQPTPLADIQKQGNAAVHPAMQAPAPVPTPHTHAPEPSPEPQPAPPQQTVQQPAPQPPQVQQPDQVTMAMLETMRGVQQGLSELLRRSDDPPVAMDNAPEKESPEKEDGRPKVYDRGQEYEIGDESSPKAVPPECDLPFLTTPPSAPRVRVIFDIPKGGRHLKRFHHVCSTGLFLSLIYDSRFEFGDQFLPPVTEEDDPPIKLTFPDEEGESVEVKVPASCNMRIGCMDIVNLVIVSGPRSNRTEPDISQEIFGPRPGARSE